MSRLCLFPKSESGASAIEYGMIAASVSVLIITGATAAGQAISGKFNYVSVTVAAVPPA